MLGRSILTIPLIDLKNIRNNIKSLQQRNFIKLPKILWFDLDETLVCRWKPIIEMLEFLKKCINHGHDIRLLTRHTFNVEETLKKINLRANIFSEIVVISKDKKKSQFVKKDHGFIDNEFAERLDVRKNTGAFVMDLDQIDYVAFNQEF